PNNSSFNSITMVPWSPDCRAPRAANLFHQFGGRVGGPILIPGLFNGRNRAFFFVNYEEFRQPTSVVRTRRILNPLAQSGAFRYNVTLSNGQTEVRQVNVLDLAARSNCAPQGSPAVPCTSTVDPTIGKLLADIRRSEEHTSALPSHRHLPSFPPRRSSDLLKLAARSNCAPQGSPAVPCTSTVDPTIGKLLADIRNATNGTGGITDFNNLNLQEVTYNPSGSSLTKRPTVRFDVNVTDKHKVELSWTYQMGRGAPDFLNNVEPAFPGFPNQGQQPADRYTGSVAVRSTLAPTLVNEARAGLSGGPSRFNPGASTGDFAGTVADQDGFTLGGAPGDNSTRMAGLGIHGPTTVNTPSRRNPLFREFSDSLTWTRGAHNLTFGGLIIDTQLTFKSQTLTPTINFSVDSADPANTVMFNNANFPGIGDTDLNTARNLYAVLTGRVTSINANAR